MYLSIHVDLRMNTGVAIGKYTSVYVFGSRFLSAQTKHPTYLHTIDHFLEAFVLAQSPPHKPTPKSSQCPLLQPSMVSLDPGHAINIHQSDPFYFLLPHIFPPLPLAQPTFPISFLRFSSSFKPHTHPFNILCCACIFLFSSLPPLILSPPFFPLPVPFPLNPQFVSLHLISLHLLLHAGHTPFPCLRLPSSLLSPCPHRNQAGDPGQYISVRP